MLSFIEKTDKPVVAIDCDVEGGGLSGRDSMELAQKLIGSPLPGAFAELSGVEGIEGGKV